MERLGDSGLQRSIGIVSGVVLLAASKEAAEYAVNAPNATIRTIASATTIIIACTGVSGIAVALGPKRSKEA